MRKNRARTQELAIAVSSVNEGRSKRSFGRGALSGFMALALSLNLVPSLAFAEVAAALESESTPDEVASDVETQSDGLIVVYKDDIVELDEELSLPQDEEAATEVAEEVSVAVPAASEDAAEGSVSEETVSDEPLESATTPQPDGTEVVEPMVPESVEVSAAPSSAADEGSPVTLEDLGVIDQQELASASGDEGAVALVTLEEGVSADEVAEALEQADEVAFVQPNYVYSLLSVETDDPYFLSALEGEAQEGQYYLLEENFPETWERTAGAVGVTIAVIDTGVNMQHEDLVNVVDAAHAYDVKSQGPLAAAGIANNGDALGHGTNVAGVLAAEANNGLGIAGGAYDARILPINVFDAEGSSTTADLIAAYDHLESLIEQGAANDLRVINLSLGYYATGNDDADEALRMAIADMRDEHGVLTVCAGGNGTAAGSAKTATLYPSDFDECLSVTALDAQGQDASFSDYNAAKDISAYGVDIVTTASNGGYEMSAGTSVAAPQVSAAAALLWAADPNLSVDQVVSALTSSAVALEGGQRSGNGSAGKVDASAAMDAVLGFAEDEDLSAEQAPDANENAVMGSHANEEEAGEAAADESAAEGTPNSFRFDDGNLISSAEGADPSSQEVKPLSIVDVGGNKVFNWFDKFSQGYYTGTDAARVIDVSEHQGYIDWAAVKRSGVDYAVIRCGWGMDEPGQDDKYWLQNVRACRANGIPFGVYIYSYATNTARASREADHVLKCLSSAGLNPGLVALPIYYDIEDNSIADSNLAATASTFCSKIQAAGYVAGVYSSLGWWEGRLSSSVFNQWYKWVAAWNCTIGLTYAGFANFRTSNGMWQFSDGGSVPGISGRVDLNYTYLNDLTNATDFVKRLYQNVLNREHDAAGLAAHVNALRSGVSAADVAWGFFGSSEFNRRNLTNDQKIDIAYLTMFDRNPDAGGKATYKAMLDSGMSLRAVISAFSRSAEYRTLCSKWGVTPGVLVVVENRDKNANATSFVQRLYQKVLGRSADVGGLNAHTGSLLSGNSAANVAWGFFGSPEFSGRNLSNSQRVEIAYLTMFDRSADASGMATYKAKLDSGMSLRAVLADFSRSAEYRALCNKWGVAAGILNVVENRDRNQNYTAFVQRFYQKVLGRTAEPGGLNAHTGLLLSGGDPAELAWTFFSSQEFKNRRLSNESIVDVAYQTMLNRNPEPKGKAEWTKKLNEGMSLRSLVSGFALSEEFRLLYKKYGL